MNKLYLGLITICLVVFFTSCSRIDNAELAKYWWKYGSGYQNGDVLIFGNGKSIDNPNDSWISGDTIYINNQAELIVTGTEEKWDGHLTLYVESIETGETTVYHGKGPKN
jgi:hypothetical protein